jgi:histidinol-phosphate phosphatase family protein
VVKRRCVFLDRDGVINVAARPGHYVRNWDEFRFIPSILDWIRLVNALDFLVIVITNQRGVARGLMTEASLHDIHDRMMKEIAEAGARIDDIFCCTHNEGECDCRKPQPGLIYQAAAKWSIDLGRSLFIGDSESDRDAAERSGVPFLFACSGAIVQGRASGGSISQTEV